jgi:hypothetical protein
MSRHSLFPRGNPLTEAMELRTADGTLWVAYIDGLPAARPRRFLKQTVLPGRRLRFDSGTESRATWELPAGSPFLSERRLIDLLGVSPLLPLAEPAPPLVTARWRRRWQTAIARGRAAWSRSRCVAADATDAVHLVVDTLIYGGRVRS